MSKIGDAFRSAVNTVANAEKAVVNKVVLDEKAVVAVVSKDVASVVKKVKDNFDPIQVGTAFKGEPVRLLRHIRKVARPRGKIRTTSRSIWPK